MVHRTIKSAATLAAAALISSTGLTLAAEPATTEPTAQELIEQIKQLQSKVEQLEARQQAEQKQASADVEETVRQIVADAEKRSTGLLFAQTEPSDVPLAGHEKGKFFLRSEDGAFTLNPFAQFQFRNVTTYTDSLIVGGVDTGSDIDNGFEMRRMKFGGSGVLFEKFEYKFVWATDRASGDVFLEDATVTYALNDNWSIFGGQYKDPVHHEELTSSTRQLAAERSLVNELIGGGVTDRVQGVGATYATDAIQVTGTFHDGQESLNTNFRDTPVNASDWGVGGRVEYKISGGDWKPYGDFTAMGNKDGIFVIGAGGDISGFDDANGIAYTVDAQWENTDGLSLYGALLGYYTEPHGGAGDSTNDIGALAQVAQMVGEKTEVFGRAGYIDFDDDDEIWEFTLGANYYLHGHNAKFTADVTYLPEGAPGDSGSGIINSGDEAQVVGRLQFQLVL